MFKKFLRFVAFTSAVIISISVLSLSAFAYDIFTPVTNNNMRLGGLSYFDSPTMASDFQDFVRSNCSSREYSLWVSPVIYDEQHKRYYVPVTSDSAYTTVQMNFRYGNDGACYYYRNFGSNGTGDSQAWTYNCTTYPKYANSLSLTTYNDSNDNIVFGYRNAHSVNADGTFKYYGATATALRWIFINNDGQLEETGYSLGDVVNASNVKWVCYLRPYSSWGNFIGISTIFELFNDKGFENFDNTVTTPEIAFPRYPSQATDKTGFYVDNLAIQPLHFYIKDNNNHHKYSLKIESAINYKNKGNDSLFNVNVQGADGTDYSSFFYDYHWVNNDFITNQDVPLVVRNCVKSDVLDRWQNSWFEYKYQCKISPKCMDYSLQDSPVASGYSVMLYDYINISESQFFLISAIDETDGRVLGQWAVASSREHSYLPGQYPFKQTYFSNNAFSSQLPTGADFKNHNAFNDTTYSSGMATISSAGDSLSDVENNKFNEYGTGDNFNFNVDINDLSTAFSTSLASVRSFFSLCLGLIPASIITIVIGSISLLVVLRILGR